MGHEIQLALPIILISILAVAAIVLDALTGKNKSIMFAFTFVGLLATAIAAAASLFISPDIISGLNKEELLTKGMITFGGYAAFFDILFCLAAIMTIFSSRVYLSKEDSEYKEFYSLILFSVSGMMLIAHSANLLIMFLGTEIMSISFYVLSGFFRRQVKSVEAALKYFLLGAFATGFLLYGMAMIYGATADFSIVDQATGAISKTGTIDIPEIAARVAAGTVTPIYLTIGLGLMIIGLSFKVAAFPFHQWAPDVYTGAPTVVTGFMSTAGKAAALIAFIIIGKALIPVETISDTIAANSDTAILIIAVISAATMVIGNITALVQRNVKRMLAYSSVAHAGYLLMGIVANNPRGWSGIVFYATAYMFMQIGAFVIVSILERKTDKNQNLEDYSGLRKSHPALAAMMALFMFSLAGIPPMAGFFGKYYLFTAAIEAGYTWLTIIAVIASIISMYFYIGLIIYMYFREPGEEVTKAKVGPAAVALFLSTAGILIFGIFPNWLIDLAHTLF